MFTQTQGTQFKEEYPDGLIRNSLKLHEAEYFIVK